MLNLVEVGDDFVEKSQTFDAFVVILHVELKEIGDRCEHDADVLTILVIKILDKQNI